jgi:regulator of sirC expression with transglutaminase-like and TPR domain
MTSATRDRLARLARRPDADLAEAALLCGCEVDPHLDVEVGLLRLDALADRLRAQGFVAGDPERDAEALAEHLAADHGFVGDPASRDPEDALLHRVLDRRRGLPITLSILYVAIGRRLRVPVYPIALPGHVVTGIAGADRPVLLDPFHGGRRVDEDELARRVEQVSEGRLAFRRSMLRPAPTPLLLRRLLNNLTQDYLRAGQPADALWTVELKLLLPSKLPEDERARGELLVRTGRFDLGAAAFEDYLELVGPDAPGADEARHAAVRARAQLN